MFADNDDLENDYIFCGIAYNGKMFHFDADKPKWCPLRPLPEKKPTKDTDKNVIYGKNADAINRGWNACLDEITGETK